MTGVGSFAGFDRASKRAALLAADRAETLRGEMVAAIAADFPGLSARVEGDEVIVEGRDLLARWLADARLRDLATARAKGDDR